MIDIKDFSDEQSAVLDSILWDLNEYLSGIGYRIHQLHGSWMFDLSRNLGSPTPGPPDCRPLGSLVVSCIEPKFTAKPDDAWQRSWAGADAHERRIMASVRSTVQALVVALTALEELRLKRVPDPS